MKVILQKQVERLGEPGDVVQVADGYARNYLIPRRLAAPITKGALRHAERVRAGQDEQLKRRRAEAEAVAGRMMKTPVRIGVQAGEDGRLFGQVTTHQIAEAMGEQLGETVDHRRINLDEPIRSVGAHQVKIHLHPEVNATLTLDVVPR
jgi:large subunit ribosomal protein L9